MTAKQKIRLIAAEYAKLVREVQTYADAMQIVADRADEAQATELFETLRATGLVDDECNLCVDGIDNSLVSVAKTVGNLAS